jgi:hypothetical protein
MWTGMPRAKAELEKIIARTSAGESVVYDGREGPGRHRYDDRLALQLPFLI